jgi:hypothetical protein
MYIFSRTTIAALGQQLQATTAAVEVAGMVGSLTGHEIKVMAAHFGAPQGTIMWTTTLDSHAQRQTMLEAMAADPDFMAKAVSLTGLFMSPSEDRMSRFLSPPLTPTSKFYTVTRAVMADGKFTEAIEFGLEITDYIVKESGMVGAFLKPSFGGFGDVSWVLGMNDAADMDRFEDWQMGDAGYQGRVAAAAGLFVPNSGVVSMVEQLN